MTGYENGYYIWQRLRLGWRWTQLPPPRQSNLVMREDLEFNQGVEAPYRYQVAIWIDGKGYDVLYYSGCMVETLEIYELTKQLQTL
jgi:hypothetical protein